NDSVRLLHENGHRSIRRSEIKLIQTPQAFRSDILITSYQTAFRESFTDDASVVEMSGYDIHLVEGESNNIKITSPIDLAIAEQLLDPPKLPA
ncbi:MAG TPA: 2-C-methyl-D-erythritol 4-phosphate cytidylyltransferase, partial [Puia sp.]